jgi:hypothetical protein
MALQKFNIGTNEDGTPRFHFEHDGDPATRVVYTGPISGKVTLPDGTEYDVTDHFIEVAPGHEGLVSCAIGKRHEAEGHPLHDPEIPFTHECTDHCAPTTEGV